MIGESAQKQSRGNQKSYSANNIFSSDSRQNFTHEELNYLNNSPPQTIFTSETLQLHLIGIVLKIVKVVLVCFGAIETFRVHVTTKVFELSSKSRELSHHKAKITSGTEQK